MSKPGPKPKPTQLKSLSGNPGKRKLNDSEPMFDVPSRMVSVPGFLDTKAAEVWHDIGRRLLAAGLFTTVDKYALAMFCVAAGRWIEAEIKLKESGPILLSTATNNLYQNPYLHVANRAWDQMRQMFGEFGLTPAERSRMSITSGPDEPSLADQLFQLVGEANNGN